jgi:uncharacterized protein (DUF2062 family)
MKWGRLLQVRSRLRVLLHLDDPPWRIALALAVGVFIGCTPFWFFQTLLALGVAQVLHLNRAATVTGVWLNLPWFAPFVYGAALRVGTWLIPGEDAAAADALKRFLAGPDSISWDQVVVTLQRVSGALLVGTTVVGVVAAVVTYVVAVRLIRVHGRQDDPARTDHRHAA